MLWRIERNLSSMSLIPLLDRPSAVELLTIAYLLWYFEGKAPIRIPCVRAEILNPEPQIYEIRMRSPRPLNTFNFLVTLFFSLRSDQNTVPNNILSLAPCFSQHFNLLSTLPTSSRYSPQHPVFLCTMFFSTSYPPQHLNFLSILTSLAP